MMSDWKKYIGVFTLAVFFSCSSYAEMMKKECVGRMQIDLPGEADIAGYSLERIAREIEIRGNQPQFQFEDGQEAGWSTLGYTGLTYISNEVTEDEYQSLSHRVEARRKINEAAAEVNRRPNGAKLKFEPIAIGAQTGFAWRVSEFHTLFLKIQKHVFFWDVSGHETDMQRNKDVTVAILAGLEYRAPNEVPRGNGVCFPFAFIKDNGSNLHLVASTFRLKSHPDVTVVLEDGVFAKPTSEGRRRVVDPQQQVADFWEQFRYGPTIKQVEPLWRPRSVRPITLAGKPAFASFVRITRTDGSVGYGFHVLGYETSAEEQDRSTRKFHMISEPSHAIARKIKPVTETEFLEMALAATKSIQHRP
jgi:hypothetical protein